MTFFIYARDGAGVVVLRRDSEEAALRRAAELKEMGWFEIDITEEDDAGAPADDPTNPTRLRVHG